MMAGAAEGGAGTLRRTTRPWKRSRKKPHGADEEETHAEETHEGGRSGDGFDLDQEKRGEMGPRGFAERERDMGPDQRRAKQGAREGLEKGRLRRSDARLACIIRPQRLALNNALEGSPRGGPAWTTRTRLDGCKTKDKKRHRVRGLNFPNVFKIETLFG